MLKKRILCTSLAVLTALSSMSLFSSCKKEEAPVKEKRTNVYSGTDLELPEGIQYINRMTATDDTVYIIYEKQIEVTHYSDGSTKENDTGMEPGIAVPAV